MSSLADLPNLVGFLSYARRDDAHEDGALTLLRQRISNELEVRLGRKVQVWQDTEAIPLGTKWEGRIPQAIAESAFFIPVISPSALNSPHCREELYAFLDREAELGRDDLVFPILYVPVSDIAEADQRVRDVLEIIYDRQYADWTKIRLMDGASAEVKQEIVRFSGAVVEALRKVSEPGAKRPPQPEIEAPRPPEEARLPIEAKRPDVVAVTLTLFAALAFFFVRWAISTSAPDVQPGNAERPVLWVWAKSPIHAGERPNVRIEVLRQSHLFCFNRDQAGRTTLLYPTGEAGERANLFGPADGEIKFPDGFNSRMRLGPMPEPAVEFFHCIAVSKPLQGALETRWFENTAAARRDQGKPDLAADRDVAADILSRLRKSEGYAETSAKIEIVR
jgi:hypothetical protein